LALDGETLGAKPAQHGARKAGDRNRLGLRSPLRDRGDLGLARMVNPKPNPSRYTLNFAMRAARNCAKSSPA